MKAILMSIQREHNGNIESGLKKSELRTMPPKIDTPFKVYTYESGFDGRHKVTNEWVCRNMVTWLMYMGLPGHLSKVACVSDEYVWQYSKQGKKNITELRISDLVIYDKPKELSEFFRKCEATRCEGCEHLKYQRVNRDEYDYDCEYFNYKIPITRPPQSWCYVEELAERKAELKKKFMEVQNDGNV